MNIEYIIYKSGNKWLSEEKDGDSIKRTEHGSAAKAFRTLQNRNKGADLIYLHFEKQEKK